MILEVEDWGFSSSEDGALVIGGVRAEALAADVASATLDAEQLMRRYCTLVYARYGSYEAAARHLGVDRRTVKARIDAEMLEELKP